MTVIHRPRPYRSGLMLHPPVALGGHAFTRTSHPGQWHCERCHTLTHDIHHTTTTGTCTGLAAAITTGAPMNPTPEPTIPIPMHIEFTAEFTGLVDVPISMVIERTKRVAVTAARQGLPQPTIADILSEVAAEYEGVGWHPGLSYDIDSINWVDALTDDDNERNEAVSAIITAELDRLADEADPERARFRPTIGQMDIFGLEVTE